MPRRQKWDNASIIKKRINRRLAASQIPSKTEIAWTMVHWQEKYQEIKQQWESKTTMSKQEAAMIVSQLEKGACHLDNDDESGKNEKDNLFSPTNSIKDVKDDPLAQILTTHKFNIRPPTTKRPRSIIDSLPGEPSTPAVQKANQSEDVMMTEARRKDDQDNNQSKTKRMKLGQPDEAMQKWAWTTEEDLITEREPVSPLCLPIGELKADKAQFRRITMARITYRGELVVAPCNRTRQMIAMKPAEEDNDHWKSDSFRVINSLEILKSHVIFNPGFKDMDLNQVKVKVYDLTKEEAESDLIWKDGKDLLRFPNLNAHLLGLRRSMDHPQFCGNGSVEKMIIELHNHMKATNIFSSRFQKVLEDMQAAMATGDYSRTVSAMVIARKAIYARLCDMLTGMLAGRVIGNLRLSDIDCNDWAGTMGKLTGFKELNSIHHMWAERMVRDRTAEVIKISQDTGRTNQ